MPGRMRMRWTAYAGVSTALAAGVIMKALAQRPNFYSAAVYLSQSSANLMILTNLLFVVACTLLLGLQKLLYGDLRPIEVEQLYEKAWFAVTETCLAMTVFRGEIGLTFLAMFFSLLAGKVWSWIGEGRVEVLEQQPPRNPRLFHTRLAVSLGLSVAFDLTMLEYVVKQVMRMARPDMMVMFGFEFGVLSIMSISTALRYAIDLVEIGIVREQKNQRIGEIKRERVQAAVSAFQEAHTIDAATTATPTPTPTRPSLDQVSQDAFNQPVDENEVEVEGWEDKGRYMFYLNLATDFFKLVLYLAFFFILLVFYGLPIHILRDVFLTMRSFLKRISDFLKYRAATRDMNARYPDATAEEIGREDVCIICREEMRPYQPPAADPAQPAARANPVAERMRPKKLPCGHVLHFACLRSWLERQQICPTCRANVVRGARPEGGARGAGPPGDAPANGGHAADGARPGPRIYQLGPFRIGVGAARGNNMFEELQQQLGDLRAPGAGPPAHGPAGGDANAPRQFGVGVRWTGRRQRRTEPESTTQEQLAALEARIQQEAEQLSRNTAELNVLRSMQTELQRLRSGGIEGMATQPISGGQHAPHDPSSSLPRAPNPVRLVARANGNMIPAGSDRLPPGLTLPDGWTMMPLQSMPSPAGPVQAPPFPATSFPNFATAPIYAPPPSMTPPVVQGFNMIPLGPAPAPFHHHHHHPHQQPRNTPPHQQPQPHPPPPPPPQPHQPGPEIGGQPVVNHHDSRPNDTSARPPDDSQTHAGQPRQPQPPGAPPPFNPFDPMWNPVGAPPDGAPVEMGEQLMRNMLGQGLQMAMNAFNAGIVNANGGRQLPPGHAHAPPAPAPVALRTQQGNVVGNPLDRAGSPANASSTTHRLPPRPPPPRPDGGSVEPHPTVLPSWGSSPPREDQPNGREPLTNGTSTELRPQPTASLDRVSATVDRAEQDVEASTSQGTASKSQQSSVEDLVEDPD